MFFNRIFIIRPFVRQEANSDTYSVWLFLRNRLIKPNFNYDLKIVPLFRKEVLCRQRNIWYFEGATSGEYSRWNSTSQQSASRVFLAGLVMYGWSFSRMKMFSLIWTVAIVPGNQWCMSQATINELEWSIKTKTLHCWNAVQQKTGFQYC